MKVIDVELSKIDQNENSRVVYKESDLTELMQSMKKDGLLQPVGLMATSGGRYEAVFGNRRIMAARKLGWTDIPATITEAESENDRDVINLLENIKRQNTTVAEDGRMFMALKDRGLSLDEIAVRLGISKVRVETAIEVFTRVPEEYRPKIVNRVAGQRKLSGQISATAAHAVLTLRKTHGLNRKQMRAMLKYASADGVSTQHLSNIAPLLKEGLTVDEAISGATRLSRVALFFFMDRTRIAKLEKKYGKSINDLLMTYLEKNTEFQVQRTLRGKRYGAKARVILRKAVAS